MTPSELEGIKKQIETVVKKDFESKEDFSKFVEIIRQINMLSPNNWELGDIYRNLPR